MAEHRWPLKKGEGCRVWDQDGRVYWDFLAGIAVTALGHSHPRVVQAIREQAGKLLHASNLVPSSSRRSPLAEQLTDHSFARTESSSATASTEANEAAIKLARTVQPRISFGAGR